MTAFSCPFEQAHGRPCLICRDGSGLFPADHPDHLVVAEGADRLAAQQLYAERGLCLEPADLAELSSDDRTSLDAWAADISALLPHGFARLAHIAGPVRNGWQHCVHCESPLSGGAHTGQAIYPVGAFVGLDCEGTP